jgi:hypothetical protein
MTGAAIGVSRGMRIACTRESIGVVTLRAQSRTIVRIRHDAGDISPVTGSA